MARMLGSRQSCLKHNPLLWSPPNPSTTSALKGQWGALPAPQGYPCLLRIGVCPAPAWATGWGLGRWP